MRHPKCYANQLDDCSPSISREHVISSSVLRTISQDNPVVLTRNLRFQPQEQQQELGIGSLVANILCDNHNQLLSDFDAAACYLIDGLDRINSTVGASDDLSEIIRVNGDDFERWMLKVACGLLFSGTLPFAPCESKGIAPPPNLLNIIFKKAKFPARQGVYLDTEKEFTSEASMLKCQAVWNYELIGFRVWLLNFKFTLVLAPIPSVLPPDIANACYRPTGINFIGSKKRIQFEWEEGGAREFGVIWSGRVRS
jgi:hypothetical protein